MPDNKDCRFLRLPRELRNHIYELSESIVRQDQVQIIPPCHNTALLEIWKREEITPLKGTALWQVSKQVRHEIAEIFYGRNFRIVDRGIRSLLRWLLGDVSREHLHLIKRVSVEADGIGTNTVDYALLYCMMSQHLLIPKSLDVRFPSDKSAWYKSVETLGDRFYWHYPAPPGIFHIKCVAAYLGRELANRGFIVDRSVLEDGRSRQRMLRFAAQSWKQMLELCSATDDEDCCRILDDKAAATKVG